MHEQAVTRNNHTRSLSGFTWCAQNYRPSYELVFSLLYTTFNSQIAMSIMLGRGCTITESPAVSVHQFSGSISVW